MSYRFKKLRRSDDHGGLEDWLMTYADMITLLLCFFAVFLSVSEPKKEIFDQAREKVLERFAGSENQVLYFPPAQSEEDAPYDSQPSIIDRYEAGKSGADEGESSKKSDAPEGDKIDIIEMPSAAFFASGSASLSEEGKRLLSDIIEKNLKAPDKHGYQITIEGHTDDVPISTLQFPSNWELSTSRAASVVRYLIEQGIERQRLRAAGYADTFPKVPNRDATGSPLPDNQAQNRRVLIKLEKIERN